MGPLEAYRYLMDEVSDPRTNGWPMISNPFSITAILSVYLIFVLYIGPMYMKNREPYSLHRFMIIYNISMAFASGLLFYGLLTSGFTTKLSLRCEPVDVSYEPEPMRMASWVWWCLILKIGELGDTIIFVLRKKFAQSSFLHIYHHVTVVISAWLACKYAPGGMWAFSVMPNCIVHIIMYSYYLFASFGPQMQRKLAPWKPYMTMLQMIQFVLIIIYVSQALTSSCEPTRKPIAYIFLSQIFSIFYLFWNFYKKTYLPKSKMG